MNAYLDAMRRYTDFSGRSNQSQFWQFVIALLAIMLSAVFLDTTFQVALPNQVGLMTVIVGVLHALPLVAVSIRRLHDTGRSGWLVALNAIPFGSVPFIALASLPSTLGANLVKPSRSMRPALRGAWTRIVSQISHHRLLPP